MGGAIVGLGLGVLVFGLPTLVYLAYLIWERERPAPPTLPYPGACCGKARGKSVPEEGWLAWWCPNHGWGASA